jgi:hypothetical protein
MDDFSYLMAVKQSFEHIDEVKTSCYFLQTNFLAGTTIIFLFLLDHLLDISPGVPISHKINEVRVLVVDNLVKPDDIWMVQSFKNFQLFNHTVISLLAIYPL